MTGPKHIRIMEYSAYGDAKGVCVEYAPPEILAQYDPLGGYVRHHKYETGNGRYSDDVQAEIAIAEVIVSGRPLTPMLLADAFVNVYKRDRRPGYASGYQALLNSVNDGTDFLKTIRPDSDKSGAAMRILPAGIFPTERQVIHFATLQACLTHSQPDGINAAIAAALMSHYFLYDLGPKAGLGSYLASKIPGPWAQPWSAEYVGQQGWMSVQAAVTAVISCDTMSELLTKCIKFGGDTDTVATIALGAAACSDEVLRDLPAAVTEGLENGPYGRDFLRGLDATLTDRMYELRQAEQARLASQKTNRGAGSKGAPGSAISKLSSTVPHGASGKVASRILVVQVPPHMFGPIEKQDYLQIPADMDVAKEEKAWFAGGGDSSGKSFAEYLISQGAVTLDVEIWSINYM